MTSHPRTRGRTAAALAGLALAAAGAGITQLDVSGRRSSSKSAITITTTTLAGPGLTPPGNGPDSPAIAALITPDPTLHPGAVNAGLDAAELCTAGFTTSTIRPPTSYTNKLKQLELGDGGPITAPDGTTYTVVGEQLPGTVADYELDHLISLEIGGNPVDPKNLWMQPWERKGDKFAPTGKGAETKDVTENRLHREICAGTLTLAAAQHEISNDWQTAR